MLEGETVEVLVEQAKEAGKVGAEVTQLEEKVEKLEVTVEETEQRQKWNDDSISNAFEKLWSLGDRVAALEAQKAEVVIPGEAQETAEETTAIEGKTEQSEAEEVVEEAQQTARKRGSKASWGLF